MLTGLCLPFIRCSLMNPQLSYPLGFEQGNPVAAVS
jgi:hypothetical protein